MAFSKDGTAEWKSWARQSPTSFSMQGRAGTAESARERQAGQSKTPGPDHGTSPVGYLLT